MSTRLLHLAGTPLTPTKPDVVIDLDGLQSLVDQYLAAQPEDSAANLRQTFMREFLMWARKREEARTT